MSDVVVVNVDAHRGVDGCAAVQAWSRPAASDLRECLDCACSVCMYATHALPVLAKGGVLC